MYRIDHKDHVRPLTDIPQSSVGAPIPVVIAGEHAVALLFYEEQRVPGWDGTTTRVVHEDSTGERVVVVTLNQCTAHFFGPPNDEAFSGHPLYERGLRPYGAFEVQDSSWLRELERRNAVHPQHDKAHYMIGKRHLVLSFHDSTFECIAKGYDIATVPGSIRDIAVRIAQETLRAVA